MQRREIPNCKCNCNRGNAPYTYAWSPSGNTEQQQISQPELIHVDYDAGGCTYSQPLRIAQPAGLTATASQTNVDVTAVERKQLQ